MIKKPSKNLFHSAYSDTMTKRIHGYCERKYPDRKVQNVQYASAIRIENGELEEHLAPVTVNFADGGSIILDDTVLIRLSSSA